MLKEIEEQRWADYPTCEKYSGLSHTTLWRFVKSGDIRSAKIGRSVRIDLRSLEQFMEERASEESVEQ